MSVVNSNHEKTPEIIAVQANRLNLVIQVTSDNDIRLLHFSALPYYACLKQDDFESQCRLVEVQAAGYDHKTHHGRKHVGTMPAGEFKYISHNQFDNDSGTKLEIIQGNSELQVISHIAFYKDLPVIRSWTEIKNIGSKAICLESVSSFVLAGIDIGGSENWEDKSRLHFADNAWTGECQWKEASLPVLGLSRVNNFSTKRILFSGCGTWPTEGYLMTGAYENRQTQTVLCWDIEHHGSWLAEISDIDRHLYLYLSGPDFLEHQWCKVLKPGQIFESVPVAVCSVEGTVQDAFAAMTKYRRVIRRPNKDNVELPVIFNDYMNCLSADPTTEKLLPLIEKAKSIRAEIYCIDAGWYGDGYWWDSVGQWLPSEKRFPGGFEQVLRKIRDCGMVPGLWLELESMGINCPLARDWPDECFFMLHGKRTIYNSRYQLDWRHPLVLQHANSVLDRVVNDYGVGYIKMDYNIHFAPGTDVASDSPGDGLLQHNSAYVDWLDEIFDRYPDLIIENCGSGGLRMCSSLLRRHSVQSVTDQTDYRKMAVIAANAPSVVPPEQSAIWSYPLADATEDEIVFNMVNAILFRIHQSGRIHELSEKGLQLVREGIDCYKDLRKNISASRPFWPLGLGDFESPWLAFGLDCGQKSYLAVWRIDSDEDSMLIPIQNISADITSAQIIFPRQFSGKVTLDSASQAIHVNLPGKYTAGLILLKS